jgi:hypothetical protein
MTARGVQIGGAGGGIPDLRPSDIARMLDGLEPGPFLAGMVRESGDVHSIGPLERHLWTETMRIADPIDSSGDLIKHAAWPRTHGQAYCQRLAVVAVFEFVVPRPEVCNACDGRGWHRVHGQGVACLSCKPPPSDIVDRTKLRVDDDPGGYGYRKMSPATRADLAGIPLKSWNDGWSERYERVHQTVCSWHSAALSHLRRALELHRAIA